MTGLLLVAASGLLAPRAPRIAHLETGHGIMKPGKRHPAWPPNIERTIEEGDS